MARRTIPTQTGECEKQAQRVAGKGRAGFNPDAILPFGPLRLRCARRPAWAQGLVSLRRARCAAPDHCGLAITTWFEWPRFDDRRAVCDVRAVPTQAKLPFSHNLFP